ncbi:hypothetical protein SARC_05783 [Sphaeroforma arctica JP610]|uniref:Uncharacterized protein n=1 Tax=Sphaeroforma arctica JP610 TaxID=667725 RepID=A0A0L0G158_9EUKA|nr:hypothetical protein SARC_05783 [Sphaeroforma arctica JP610]KNC81933.1 hypothetical protein SARC_05783 [Sphaeroforma arctica JP610]|eukprot:XP_014155835.1 hypothetical protein SARC_05783 [Sphaeroforma arctica JP610]
MFAKSIIVAAVLATSVIADTAQVQIANLFTDTECVNGLKSEVPTTVAKSNGCIFLQDQVVVDGFPSSMNSDFSFTKKSDVENEILLFNDGASCEGYQADANVPVAFIRSTTPNECVPCYRCGNVKSVSFSNVEVTDTSGKSNAAGTAVPSSLLTVGVIAMTGYAFYR